MMKILLSAYSCNPNKGSEPGVGWNWLMQISRFYKVWCITRWHNKKDIEFRLFQNDSNSKNIQIALFDLPLCKGRFQENSRGERIYYVLWHLFSVITIIRLHKKIQFDIFHQVTWNTFKLPTLLWIFRRKTVWGPIGGGEFVPSGFFSILGTCGKLFEFIRMMFTQFAKHSLFLKLALRKTDLILFANQSTYKYLNISNDSIKALELETGILLLKNLNENNTMNTNLPCEKIDLLWVGVFSPRKGLPLLLEALSRLPSTIKWSLTVVGDGSERKRWEKIAHKLNIYQFINFMGWVPHNELDKFYLANDVFVFTSLRDTSGNVLLEAMNYNIPIIALNLNGVSDILDEKSAILIETTNIEQVIQDLGLAIVKMLSPLVRQNLAEAASRKLKTFEWDAKGNRLLEFYESI